MWVVVHRLPLIPLLSCTSGLPFELVDDDDEEEEEEEEEEERGVLM